ncbi:MAG: VaFE repeat-containing surface-anchored protein [Actinomycetota bacterium]
MVHENRTYRKGGARRVFATALFAIGTALVAFAAPAAAVEPGDPVWVGDGIGYGGTSIHAVYSPIPADTGNPGTADLWAYCLENQVTVRPNASGIAGDYSSYVGENLFTDPAVQAKVHWVITHAYPAVSLADLGAAAGVTDLTLNDAIEGAQYAVWRYTDLGFDASWDWETPASQAVYEYLVDGANADTATTPPPTSAAIDVSVTGPAAPGEAGALYGPFVVSTNQATVSVTADPAVTITDSTGTPTDTDAVVDGDELYLDLTSVQTAGSATIIATVDGASGTGLVISTPVEGNTTATPESHAQSLVLVAAEGATTSASAEGIWSAAAVPTIGTTLVDSADQDHDLAWNGGTVIDTITYSGLTPGQQYTVSGELMRQADGSGTGITGSTTFTPEAAEGTVDVTFVVPVGYAGVALVAFEYLYEGDTAEGAPVAEHADIADAAQTVTVDVQPAVTTPGTGGDPTGGQDPAAPTTSGQGALAATGAELPVSFAALGMIAIIVGSVLMVARRTARVSNG